MMTNVNRSFMKISSLSISTKQMPAVQAVATQPMPLMQPFRPAMALAPTAPQFAAAPIMRPGHPMSLAPGMYLPLQS